MLGASACAALETSNIRLSVLCCAAPSIVAVLDDTTLLAWVLLRSRP